MKRLAIVVPCYNEQEVMENTAIRLTDLMADLIQKKKISADSYILFVDDGSTDGTWELMNEAFEKDPHVCALSLAGNSGQQNALMAGFAAVADNCDMAVSIDADLQDDIDVMEEMIDEYYEGADVIYGVRNDRKTDTFFKRFSAQMFYALMKLLGAKTVSNHADYRLMSSDVLRQLMRYGERNLFVRGVVPLMGYQSRTVYYARKKRAAGKSKYSLSKMFSTAFEAITSFSIKPISLIVMTGAAITVCALAALVLLLGCSVCGRSISDGKYILTSVWLLGGMQLAAVGVVGEYAGRTYFETKRRPRYRIERILSRDQIPTDGEESSMQGKK